MTTPKKPIPESAIGAAIRAKREHRPKELLELDALEASLLADINSFDLTAAQRQAHQDEVRFTREVVAAEVGSDSTFPRIQPEGVASPLAASAKANAKPVVETPQIASPPEADTPTLGLLEQLRQEAAHKQQAMKTTAIQRNATNEALDRGLREVFHYLHELAQQLNILHPVIARPYYLLDSGEEFADLTWEEGFSDYRTQPESQGGLIELVTFSYRLTSPRRLQMERSGAGIERLRSALFDYGLPFDIQEFRNERRQVERANFDIKVDIGVNTRWQADFERGLVILEARNLERLGSTLFSLPVESLSRAMLEEFGRLVLGQNSRFREFLKR